MDELVKRACQIVGADPKRVIKSRQTGEAVIVIVDNGIKGCPKYIVPLSDLEVLEPESKIEIIATAGAIAYAKTHGVDLTTVKGTGRGGRILMRDVRGAADGQ